MKELILIFDEVKVGLKLHHHAKSGKLLGLAMSADELHDVFQTIQIDHRSQKALYSIYGDILLPISILLGLIIQQVSNKFIIATLYETIHALHLYGFNTKAIVCDGASSNMATIKQLTGFGSGAYGVQDENAPILCDVDIASTPRGTNTHEVKAWFLNPHTNEKVYTLICPSHQVSVRFIVWVNWRVIFFFCLECPLLEQFNFLLSSVNHPLGTYVYLPYCYHKRVLSKF